MSEEQTTASVVAASDIEVDHASLDASIAELAGKNGDYYAKQFHKIPDSGRTDAHYRSGGRPGARWRLVD